MATWLNCDIRGDLAALARPARSNEAALRNAVGRGVTRLVSRHLAGLNAPRANDLGGVRTHFYAHASRSTNYAVTSDGVTISINWQGIRQRYEGGIIKAGRNGTKLLTIPACAEAYGHRAKEFKLKFVKFRTGRMGLVVDEAGGIQGKRRVQKNGRTRNRASRRGFGKLMFWLVPSVVQFPDPTVLPTRAEIVAAAQASAARYYLALQTA